MPRQTLEEVVLPHLDAAYYPVSDQLRAKIVRISSRPRFNEFGEFVAALQR